MTSRPRSDPMHTNSTRVTIPTLGYASQIRFQKPLKHRGDFRKLPKIQECPNYNPRPNLNRKDWSVGTDVITVTCYLRLGNSPFYLPVSPLTFRNTTKGRSCKIDRNLTMVDTSEQIVHRSKVANLLDPRVANNVGKLNFRCCKLVGWSGH
jgi:hypothetical protein